MLNEIFLELKIAISPKKSVAVLKIADRNDSK